MPGPRVKRRGRVPMTNGVDSSTSVVLRCVCVQRCRPRAGHGGIMDSEIADEELADLEDPAGAAVRRVLDQDPIREPIRLLSPRTPLCLAPDASLREAVRVMREHHVGCVLAVENDRLAGILTARDLLPKLEAGDLSRRGPDVMTPGPRAA